MSKKNQTSLIDLADSNNSSADVLRKLKIQLMTISRMKIPKIKIYHGHGLSADGDNIRNIVRAELLEHARKERIKAFCPGEVFGPFEKEGRKIVEVDPSFRDDDDWTKSNSEITVVAL